jgi:hypothetical protein
VVNDELSVPPKHKRNPGTERERAVRAKQREQHLANKGRKSSPPSEAAKRYAQTWVLFTNAETQALAVAEYAAVLLIELPQREIGGQLPDWDDLVAQIELARSHGTALHLDGARLLECLPHYGKTAAEVAGLFDSVYISLYKGLGGFAGAVLAGDTQLVAEAREWRHRHGGNMFALWPVAASGLAGLRRRAPLMPRYVDHAREICAELATIDGVAVVPDPPVTNMAHLHLHADRQALQAAIRALAQEEKTWTWSWVGTTDLPDRVYVELTVGEATLEWSPGEVRDLVAGLLASAGSIAKERAH